MPRDLHLDDDGLTVEFRGLLLVGTLHRRVRVPWAAVREVSTEPYALRPPPLRLGRHALRRELHGRFRRARRWLLISFSDPDCVVRLVLDRSVRGAPAFDEVVLGDPDPAPLAERIRARALSPGPAPA